MAMKAAANSPVIMILIIDVLVAALKATKGIPQAVLCLL
jgi:hypothetical protein